jgi:hypothetical protein
VVKLSASENLSIRVINVTNRAYAQGGYKQG